MIDNKHKLHLLIERHMDLLIEELADEQILVDFWYSEGLVENMTNAVVNVIETSDETQQWLREQSMLDE